MIKMINCFTGTEMFVAEDRKQAYLAAGHRLVAEPVKQAPQKAGKSSRGKGSVRK